MELIAEITDKSVGGPITNDTRYKIRRAVRCIVLNSANQVAVQYESKDKVYKLPGGGIKENESVDKALVREVKEETGHRIRKREFIGIIIEFRSKSGLIQISYCFLLLVNNKPNKLDLTRKEKRAGCRLMWVKGIEKAAELIRANKKSNENDQYFYALKFLAERDLLILKKAKKLMKNW